MGCFGNDRNREVLTREVMDWREIHARPYELTLRQEECMWSALLDMQSKIDKEEKSEEH